MFCPKCGEDTGGCAFCPNCGTKVEATSGEPEEEIDFQSMASMSSVPVGKPSINIVHGNAGQPQSVTNPAPVNQRQTVPVNQVNVSAPAAQPPQKDNKKTIIIAVAAVVIVLIIAVAAVVIIMNNNSKDDNDDKDTETKTETVVDEEENSEAEDEEYADEEESAYEDEEEDEDYGNDFYAQNYEAGDDDFYTYADWCYDGSDTIAFIKVTNYVSEEVGLTLNANAYGEDGEILGSDYNYIDQLGCGETTVTMLRFTDVYGVANIDYTITYQKTGGGSSCISYMSYNASINSTEYDCKANISVTNDSDRDFDSAEIYVLFYDESGYLVDYRQSYIDSGNGFFEAGDTVEMEFSSYDQGANNCEIYFCGY